MKLHHDDHICDFCEDDGVETMKLEDGRRYCIMCGWREGFPMKAKWISQIRIDRYLPAAKKRFPFNGDRRKVEGPGRVY